MGNRQRISEPFSRLGIPHTKSNVTEAECSPGKGTLLRTIAIVVVAVITSQRKSAIHRFCAGNERYFLMYADSEIFANISCDMGRADDSAC